MNNKNAYIGKNVETLFKNSIGDHKDIIEKIRKYFGIKVNWRLPESTHDRVIKFYGMNKLELDLQSDRDAADHLLNLSLDAYKIPKTGQK